MCAPCQAAAAALANSPNYNNNSSLNIPNSSENCTITRELLQSWQNALKCVKQKGKGDLINMALASINQVLGILQSALNYPDNYCYYTPELEAFKSIILPQIIANVPECIN